MKIRIHLFIAALCCSIPLLAERGNYPNPKIAQTDKGAVTPRNHIVQASQSDPITLTMNNIEFDYYPSFNKENMYDYSLFIWNEEANSYLPQVSLDIYTTSHKDFPGEYSVSNGNIGLEYSALYIASDNSNGYETITLNDAYCTISLNDDQFTISGYLSGTNGQDYTFSVTAQAYYADAEHVGEPETAQTLDMTIQSGEIKMTDIEDGWISVNFTTADGTKIMLVYKTTHTDAETIPDGTYSVTSDSYESFLVGYYSGTSSAPVNSYATGNDTYYYINSGTVQVTTDNLGKRFNVDVTSFYGTPFQFSYLFANSETPTVNHSGQCGSDLYWELLSNGTLVITGSGDMYSYSVDPTPWWDYKNDISQIILPDGLTSIGRLAFTNLQNLVSTNIPEGVTSIGFEAFCWCTSLENITIPSSVSTIDEGAFYNCSALQSITCKANTPPACGENVFGGEMDKSIPVYVPAGSVNAYKAADQWKDFTNIQSIGGEPQPSTQTVYLDATWWNTDDKQFYTYQWRNEPDFAETNVKMLHVQDNIYKAEVDPSYPNIIFVRIDGSAEEFSWSYMWHQTEDLVLSDDYNLYSILPTTGNYKSEGYWTVYGQQTENLTVAEAISRTYDLGDGMTSDQEYHVVGYVVDAHPFDWNNHDQTFFLSDDFYNSGGQSFQAYYCTAFDGGRATPVLDGDRVILSGRLTKYINKEGTVIPEIKGGKASFLSMQDGDRSQPEAETLTVAQAVEMGMRLDSAGTSASEYIVEGYVINAEAFNIGYRNQTWYMSDDMFASSSEFQAFHCHPILNGDTMKVLNGDRVQLRGRLYKYWNNATGSYLVEIRNTAASFISMIDGDHTVSTNAENISVSRALELAASLAEGETGTTLYCINGYVTLITDNSFSTTYNNMTFWIADENNSASSNAEGAFYVYRGKPDVELQTGDRVQVLTVLKNFRGIIESETGATVTRITDQPVIPTYTVTVSANNDSWGFVTGSGTYEENAMVTLTATAYDGYEFVKWSDSLTYNPRYIQVTSDINLTAIFKEKQTDSTFVYYTMTVTANNSRLGYVTGSGTYEEWSTATIEAVPYNGARFVKWSDGETFNPRYVTMSSNQVFTAIFCAVAGDATNLTNIQRGTYDTSAGVIWPWPDNANAQPWSAPMGLDENGEEPAAVKIMINGQLLIIRADGTRYDARGQRVQ